MDDNYLWVADKYWAIRRNATNRCEAFVFDYGQGMPSMLRLWPGNKYIFQYDVDHSHLLPYW